MANAYFITGGAGFVGAHLACHLLMQHHGAAPSAAAPTRSNVEVITPFNLPANLSR